MQRRSNAHESVPSESQEDNSVTSRSNRIRPLLGGVAFGGLTMTPFMFTSEFGPENLTFGLSSGVAAGVMAGLILRKGKKL